MEREFWLKRWQTGDIGFHRDDVHPALLEFWGKAAADSAAKVFVPLCGKSLDMRWLAARGHPVLGVELSEQAVDEFFTGEGLEPEVRRADGFAVKSAGRYEIWCGDYFALPTEALADVGTFYDRASLIALPPAMRERYAARLAELLPAGTQGLLVTIDYDPAEMNGPPFSVTSEEVSRLFGQGFSIDELSLRDVLSGNPGLVKRGLTALTESCHLLRRSP